MDSGLSVLGAEDDCRATMDHMTAEDKGGSGLFTECNPASQVENQHRLAKLTHRADETRHGARNRVRNEPLHRGRISNKSARAPGKNVEFWRNQAGAARRELC